MSTRISGDAKYIKFLESENRSLTAEVERHRDEDWGYVVDSMERLVRFTEKKNERLEGARKAIIDNIREYGGNTRHLLLLKHVHDEEESK
jgi:hypothetical protein